MLLRVLLTGIFLILLVGLISCSGEQAQSQSDAQVAMSPSGEASAQSADLSSADPEIPPDPPPAASAGGEVVLDPNAVSWTAKDIDGVIHESSEWIGKQPVVINFWGTWCPPCRREIPDLVKAYQEFSPRGVEIISIALRDSPGKVRDYAAKANMDWVMLMGGDQKMLADYRFSGGVPTTIFLDRSGKEITRFVGPRNLAVFRQAFAAIL